MGKLDGKVAIITGSTSGMGRATAYLFAKEGAKVVVTGRNEARAKAVVDKIKAEGGEAIYVLADAADSSYAQTNHRHFDEQCRHALSGPVRHHYREGIHG